MLKVNLCDLSSVAKNLVDSLDGSRTASGNRVSPYFTIAWAAGDSKARDVSVAIVENVADVDGPPYYTIYLRDGITGEDSEPLYTKDLTMQSLIEALDEMGKGLPEEIEDEKGAEAAVKGDPYKVKQLDAMIAGESVEGEVHYGVQLFYWRGGTEPINISRDALLLLREYYMTHHD